MAQLNAKQKKFLRGLAHKASAVVYVGQKGVSSGVLREIDASLGAHELIKVKFNAADQADFQMLCDEAVGGTEALMVQKVGHTVTLFRQNKADPKIQLPRP